MKIKKQLQKVVNKLADASFKDGRMLETQVVRSIKILKSLSRNEVIPALSEYLRCLKREEREHTLHIETAAPLTSLQVSKMKTMVEKKSLSGKQIKISKVLVSINPEILGGFKMRVGWEIWDGSVLGTVNQIKEVIKE